MMQFDKVALTRRDALRRGLTAVAASGAVFAAPRGAFAEDTLAEVKKRGELTTATEMQFPPFDISDNGVYKGLDRDLVDAVAKEMGVKVSYLDLPWTSVLPGLEAKKFDHLHRAGDHYQGTHEALLFLGADRRRDCGADEARQRFEHHEARGYRGQDGRGTEGHLAG